MAFFASFLQYLITFFLFACVAVGGVFLGKTFRQKKDQKTKEKI